ncbi:TPA: hypothetical protein HA318_06245 [Candidatus Micrarchaeota archaeon]|nr:MAG: hypothetical protein AUJ65_04020 [Candidatus Micrarchaeota archaeon CG1_02_51_15]HII39570.1 hypothetical protein [Candidatus Micrarchaeota archaeon]
MATKYNRLLQDPEVQEAIERIARGNLETFFAPGDEAFDAAANKIERLWQLCALPATCKTFSPSLRNEVFGLRKAAVIDQRLSISQLQRIGELFE